MNNEQIRKQLVSEYHKISSIQEQMDIKYPEDERAIKAVQSALKQIKTACTMLAQTQLFTKTLNNEQTT